jgi:pSer/pThr/pTyr-binding forkhead associated (FHA) protein
MAVTLIVLAGGEPELKLTFDSPRLLLGRGPSCDLRLPDPTVSLRHASLRLRGTEYFLVDEGSTNGTTLGSVKLAPQSPRVMRTGERVRLGRVWVELRIEPALATPQPVVAAGRLALALVTRGLAAQGEDGRPRVHVLRGPDAGKEIIVSEAGERYTIGRGAEASLVLSDEGTSRRHADVGLHDGQITVRDLGSKTGSLLDGAPLGPDATLWRPGQVLAIGGDELTIAHPAAEALSELERSPDEPMPHGEEVPAPAKPGSEASIEPAPVADHESEPILPRRARQPAPSSTGWTATDLGVVVLALGILALSITGLFFLLRA